MKEKLDFLKNKILYQICIGANETIFNFSGDVSITVESKFEIVGNDETLFSRGADISKKLLGAAIVEATIDIDKTLKITFNNSYLQLRIFGKNDGYESYQIVDKNNNIVH
jgi:hypothetical protein